MLAPTYSLIRNLQWLTRSKHAEAWQAAQSFWHGITPLQHRPIPGSQPLLQERHQSLKTQANTAKKLALVAAIACVVITLNIVAPLTYWQADHITAKGEQKQLTLADGSTVMLNSDLAIALHYTANERRVKLSRRGVF